MRMSRILGLIGGGEAPFDASSYTFTGHAQLTTDEDGNWELQLKTSGTLTFNRKKKFAIDVFCAGGGGGGASTTLINYGSGGGGGGRTATGKNVEVEKNGSYTVTIGAGGGIAAAGGTSSFGSVKSAGGGSPGTASYRWGTGSGGNGGSGGGAGAYSDNSGSAGGTNGGNGGSASAGNNPGTGGTGQGTTTKSFGEASST